MSNDRFREYNDLASADKRGLLEINFYRFKHNLPLIEVPDYELNYHKKFAKMITEHIIFTTGKPKTDI